nr:hypothetical protein [Tanacetum cinerariifolium]
MPKMSGQGQGRGRGRGSYGGGGCGQGQAPSQPHSLGRGNDHQHRPSITHAPVQPQAPLQYRPAQFMPPSNGMGRGQGAQPVASSSCVFVQQQTPMQYRPSQSMPPSHGVGRGRVSLPLVPSSSKLIKPPARPGFGMVGRKVMITANNFLVQLGDKNPHQYDFYRGLKQRDPVAPYLFILVMESLHLSFFRIVDAGIFKGVGVPHGTVQIAAVNLGCSIMKTPFKYLGVMVGGNSLKFEFWGDIMSKLNSRMSKWKSKTLSIGGRLTLLKSVLGVTITLEVTSKTKCKHIMQCLIEQYKASHLVNRGLAYDGKKSAFAVGPLPFENKEFVIVVPEKDGQHDNPQETIQALDIVLREAASSNERIIVGRSIFSTAFEMGSLGNGVDYCRGFYQSLRPTQIGLSLNLAYDGKKSAFAAGPLPFENKEFVTIVHEKDRRQREFKVAVKFAATKDIDHLRQFWSDMSARAFYRNILLSDFVSEYLGKSVTRSHSDQDRIMGFNDANGTTISILRYYREKYDTTLRVSYLPGLIAGTDAKLVCLPMEV